MLCVVCSGLASDGEHLFFELMLRKARSLLQLCEKRAEGRAPPEEIEAAAIAEALGQTHEEYESMLRWQRLREEERDLERMMACIAEEELRLAKEEHWQHLKWSRQRDRLGETLRKKDRETMAMLAQKLREYEEKEGREASRTRSPMPKSAVKMEGTPLPSTPSPVKSVVKSQEDKQRQLVEKQAKREALRKEKEEKNKSKEQERRRRMEEYEKKRAQYEQQKRQHEEAIKRDREIKELGDKMLMWKIARKVCVLIAS